MRRLQRLVLIVWALACPSLALAQGGVPASPIYFSGPTGRPLAGATVTFCTSAGIGFPCSPLASIFTNAGLSIASPNPVTTDGNGNIPTVFAAPGVYVLSVTGSGITPTLVTATVAGTGAGNVTTSGNNAFTGLNTFTGAGVFTGTYTVQVSSLVNGLNPVTENFSMGEVAVTGGVAVPAGSNAITNAGVAGFANTLCNSVSRTVCNADGGYFEGRCLANLSACWGINPLVQDVVGLTGHNMSGIELDQNVSGTPSFYKAFYLLGGGAGTIPATATGFEVGTTYTLPIGFICDRGSCTVGMQLNDALRTNPSASQDTQFVSHDAGAVQHISKIKSDANGNLTLQSDTGNVTLPNANAYSLTTAGGTIDPVMTMDASANVTVQGDPTTKAVFLKSAPSVLNMLLTGTGMCNDSAAAQLCKHKRITTGSIGATTRAEVLLTWGTTFADANYSVACSVEDSTTAAGTQGLTGERVRTHSASQVGFVINNPTAGGVTGTLDCWAVHD